MEFLNEDRGEWRDREWCEDTDEDKYSLVDDNYGFPCCAPVLGKSLLASGNLFGLEGFIYQWIIRLITRFRYKNKFCIVRTSRADISVKKNLCAWHQFIAILGDWELHIDFCSRDDAAANAKRVW